MVTQLTIYVVVTSRVERIEIGSYVSM